jgi:hypothetical protein
LDDEKAGIPAACDPSRPPRHGPLAESRFDPALGRWRVRLTDLGRLRVEEYLLSVGGPAWRKPARRLPKVMAMLRCGAVLPDDLESAAHHGVVNAARYAPTDGPLPPAFVYYRVLARLGHLVASRKRDIPRSAMTGGDPDRLSAAGGESCGAGDVERLRAALGRLPPDEREVVLAKYGMDGYPSLPVAQVAAGFGLNRSAFAQRVVRAERKLRKIMSEAAQNPPPDR